MGGDTLDGDGEVALSMVRTVPGVRRYLSDSSVAHFKHGQRVARGYTSVKLSLKKPRGHSQAPGGLPASRSPHPEPVGGASPRSPGAPRPRSPACLHLTWRFYSILSPEIEGGETTAWGAGARTF